jgi:molybdate transport system ATP-binding protein
VGISIQIVKRLKGFHVDVSWEVKDELAVLFGHSGAGKSLTLQMIAGLMTPDEGFVISGGTTLFDSGRGINIPPQKRHIGYVFQDRVLFPHMTVEENIGFGLKEKDRRRKGTQVAEMIETFYLRGLEKKYPSEISGGQKQRVTLARALISRPGALLLDEPFSALDNALRAEMRQLIREVRQRFNTSIVLVTHDIMEAYTMGEKVILYSDGRVAQVGSPAELFNSPSSPDMDLFLALNFPFLVGGR